MSDNALQRWIMSASKSMRKINMVAAFFCGVLVFLYMFLVSFNIAGRYLFNTPLNGTMEIGQLVLASIIFFNLAYAQGEKAHIRVTAVLDQFPSKWRHRIETITLVIGFLMMMIMAWRSVIFAVESFHIREAHMSVDVPIWPTKFIFLIGWIMLGIQFFLEILSRIFAKSNDGQDMDSIKG